MKITLAAVCSADGLMTRGDDVHVQHWSSNEDYAQFMELVNSHSLLVMGRKTYEAVQPEPQLERLRIVLTSKPERFADLAIPGQLEFRSASPNELITSLGTQGHTDMLLLGGGLVNAAFLQAALVNEMYLTLEPVLFGTGTPLLGNAGCNTSLQLLSSKQLNAHGTLLLHYRVNSPALDDITAIA